MQLDRLRELYESIVIAGLERTVARDAPHYAHNVAFARQRFQEGVELAAYFPSKYNAAPLRILDLGAGSGGVSLPLAAVPGYRVVAADVVVNPDLMELRARSGVNVEQVVASADRLPFDDAS